jgi:hypothetical protein
MSTECNARELDFQALGNRTVIARQPFYVWKEPIPGESDPVPSDGRISFRIPADGPVLLAVTDRWGGGGNSSGGWIPGLSVQTGIPRPRPPILANSPRHAARQRRIPADSRRFLLERNWE